MLAIDFEGAREIGKPPSMTDEQCGGLPIFQAVIDKTNTPNGPEFAFAGFTQAGDMQPPYPFTVSCWMPSKEDREAILAGRPIWVRFLSHKVYPMSLFTLDEAGEINE
jgi:hypothetical protein